MNRRLFFASLLVPFLPKLPKRKPVRVKILGEREAAKYLADIITRSARNGSTQLVVTKHTKGQS